jgi:hypothetical protein
MTEKKLHPNLDLKIGPQFIEQQQFTGDFGVELEVEGTNLPHEVSGWTIKPENSLRGEGLEYATKGPYNVNGLSACLDKLYKAMTKPGTVVTPSPRCSTHIHVNFQHETFGTLIGYILIATIIEPVLLRLCGPERNGNVFCMPVQETGGMTNFVTHLTYYLKLRPGKFDCYAWPQRGKYAAFNTDALSNFGSIETRCFPLSVEPSTVMKWVSWLSNMRDMARSWPDRTFRSLLEDAYTQPEVFLAKIFGYQQFHSLCAPNNVSDFVRAGVENAYELYRATRPLHDYVEEAKPQARSSRLKKKPAGLFAPPPGSGTWWDDEPINLSDGNPTNIIQDDDIIPMANAQLDLDDGEF